MYKRILLIDDEPGFWVLMTQAHPQYDWHWSGSIFTGRIMIKHQLPDYYDLILIDMQGIGLDRGDDKVSEIIPCLLTDAYNPYCMSGRGSEDDKSNGFSFIQKDRLLKNMTDMFKEKKDEAIL